MDKEIGAKGGKGQYQDFRKIKGIGLFKNLEESLEAWDFCARILNPLQGDEELPSYRRQCMDLLHCVLGIDCEAIRKWGDHFQKMPGYYKRSLWWAWLVYSVSFSEIGVNAYKAFLVSKNNNDPNDSSFGNSSVSNLPNDRAFTKKAG